MRGKKDDISDEIWRHIGWQCRRDTQHGGTDPKQQTGMGRCRRRCVRHGIKPIKVTDCSSMVPAAANDDEGRTKRMQNRCAAFTARLSTDCCHPIASGRQFWQITNALSADMKPYARPFCVR